MSFVSKPKTAATSSAKKPTFRVLRKKAALSNKKNVDLSAKFSITPPQIITTKKVSENTSSQEVESALKQIENSSSIAESVSEKVVTTFPQKSESQANAQSNSGVPRKPKPSSATTNRTVISSLFKYNPEIPVLKRETVETTKETVFSLKKFSDLNLHDHLVLMMKY